MISSFPSLKIMLFRSFPHLAGDTLNWFNLSVDQKDENGYTLGMGCIVCPPPPKSMCPSPNHCPPPPPHNTALGDQAYEEVTKAKWGYEGGIPIQKVEFWQEEEEFCHARTCGKKNKKTKKPPSTRREEHSHQKLNRPFGTLIWGFQLPASWENPFLLCKPPNPWYSFMAALAG